MFRKLLSAAMAFAIALAPLALAPMAFAAAAQSAAMPTDCECPPEHQGTDQANTTGCPPTANCMLQCLGVQASVIPAAYIVGVRYAITVRLPTRLEGRPWSANFPPFRPPTV